MADDILDIIHRITYQVNGQQSIDKVMHLFEKNAIEIGKNSEALMKLRNELDKTSDPTQQAKIRKSMEERTAAIDGEKKAIQQTLLNNREYHKSLQAEMGILASLKTRIDSLKTAREGASSVIDIRKYDQEIERIQALQARLLGLSKVAAPRPTGLIEGLDKRYQDINKAMFQSSDRSQIASYREELASIARERDLLVKGTTPIRAEGLLQNIRGRISGLTSMRDESRSKDQIAAITKEIQKLEKEYSTLMGQVKPRGGVLSSIGQGITQGLGVGVGFGAIGLISEGIGALKQFGVESFKAAANFEQLQVAFATMTGSQSAGDKLIKQIQDFAQITPYGTTALADLSKQLLAYGFGANEIIPTIDMLGNVAAGVGKDKMPSLVLAFGQIRATGRLMGQELLQLTNAGFNPLQIISDETGQSMRKLRKDMEDGKITFKMVEDAFKTTTSAGGKFFNLMQQQSKTTAGRIDAMGDSVEKLRIALGSKMTGTVGQVIDSFTELVETVTGWISLDAAGKVEEERVAFNVLVQELIRANKEGRDRTAIVSELNKNYPTLIGNLDLQTASEGKLLDMLTLVNGQFKERIRLAGLAEAAQKDQAAAVKESAAREAEINTVISLLSKAGVSESEIARIDFSKIETSVTKRISGLPREYLSDSAFKKFANQLDATDRQRVENAFDNIGRSNEYLPELERRAATSTGRSAEQSISNSPRNVIKRQIEQIEADLKSLDQVSKLTQDYTGKQQKQISLTQNLLRLKSQLRMMDEEDAKAGTKSATIIDEETKKQKAVPITLEEAVRRAQKLGATITATTGGKHNKGSAHYEGRALDLRTRDKSPEEIAQMIAQLEAMGLSVRDERIQPKGQKVWGGPHLHVSWKKGSTWKDGSYDEMDLEKIQEDWYKTNIENIQYQNDLARIQDEKVIALRERLGNLKTSLTDYYLSADALTDTPEKVQQIDKSYRSAIDLLDKALEGRINEMDYQMYNKLLELAQNSNNPVDVVKYQEAVQSSFDKAQSIAIDFKIKIRDVSFDKSNVEAILKSMNLQTLMDFSTFFDARNAQTPERDRPFRERIQSDGTVLSTRAQKAQQDVIDNQKKIEESEKKKRKERIDATVWGAQEISNAIISIAQNELDQKMRLIDAEIEYRERRMDRARELAEKGNVEVLKREQDSLDQLFKKREEIGKKQIALNALIQASELAKAAASMAAAIGEIAAGGDPYTAAIRIAAAGIAMAAAISQINSSISQLNTGGYYDGGYTGDGGKYDPAGTVHKGEFVFDQEKTKQFRPLFEAIHNNKVNLTDFTMPRQVSLPELHRPEVQNNRELKDLKAQMVKMTEAINNISVNANQTMNEHGLSQRIEFVKRKDRNRFR